MSRACLNWFPMTPPSVQHLPQNARALSDVARELANALISLKALGVTDRWIFSDILKATLEKHPHFWGVWTIWEPDALDGRDREFANQRGHDASGRYAPHCEVARAPGPATRAQRGLRSVPGDEGTTI